MSYRPYEDHFHQDKFEDNNRQETQHNDPNEFRDTDSNASLVHNTTGMGRSGDYQDLGMFYSIG
jgi:hypothetical protein